MGNKEEAEWVLERLITTLNRELEAMRKEELESEGGDKGEENMTKDKPGKCEGPSTDPIQTINDEKEKNKS
jgi:potassium channel subfamily K